MIIHYTYQTLFKIINRRFLNCLFIVLFFSPTVAVANNFDFSETEKPSVELSKAKKAKKAKKRRKPPGDYSRSGGSRGCPGEVVPLTVLAPNTFVGETISVRPTFAWYISKSLATEFRLFELRQGKAPKRVGSPIKFTSTSGINKFSLPQNQPSLTVGKSYIWQVSMNCPDGPFIQRAEFSVVNKPFGLDGKLFRANSNSRKAYIYAEQDLWYEAIGEALKNAPQSLLGEIASKIVENLAQSDSFIPEQTPADKQKILQQQIQQRKIYLEEISGKG